MTSQDPSVSQTNKNIYENLKKLISTVDNLRDVGLHKYIDLPRIVVVGTQSSGKSSVLESVVGLDFLPRGSGVCTRRPLELRMVHLAEDEATYEMCAVFGHDSTKKFYNLNDVKNEIENQTNAVAGSNCGIVDDPITLTIHSKSCADLTLIDLPGITRVPLKNSDQSEDIEKITRDMTLRYISDARTIILAVIAGNQDMTTSDALQLARSVDPQGYRTIGVITKLDIMDKGTDALGMLRGEEVPLRLGYVGVKLRSQEDINNKMTVKEAIDAEKQYFNNHIKYSKLPVSFLGTSNLIEKLTKVLFRHIKKFLPDIQREISQKKLQVSDRLAELGEGVPLEFNDQIHSLWLLITDYCDMFKNTIRGKYDKRLQGLYTSGDQEVSGGSQIKQLFTHFLQNESTSKLTDNMSAIDIEHAIRVHEGDSLPGFVSSDTFEYLILPHLRQLEQPSLDCLNHVCAVLDSLVLKISRYVFRRFPLLAEKTLESTNAIFTREKENTRNIIEKIITAETGYLFTNDQFYWQSHSVVKPSTTPPEGNAQQLPAPSVVTNYSEEYIKEVSNRLDRYFAICVRNIRDAIPKSIGFFMVRTVLEKLQFELYNSLSKVEVLEGLLSEPPHIREERKQLVRQLKVLESAANVLSRDPSILMIYNIQEDVAFYGEVAGNSGAGGGNLNRNNVGLSTPATTTGSLLNLPTSLKAAVGGNAPILGGKSPSKGNAVTTAGLLNFNSTNATASLFESSFKSKSNPLFDD